ncbi:23S rRNA (uracil(1939)-C(5))-methyltransferase RlmD [Pseudolactococcus insecticola]|uniref:Putative RNA methyltransferase YljE n=1 Tax=Pseudolactococcus insecticola TaxID=2709158 RepID=A0A6A0B6X4_9LACT|nr:23S rRNA (uracil(1939)-C(5))-methyltransferase RlmD [Lactococcus insecticola]GFH40054.1 putative RNA methyltransferase YljE [Lactococcus insecticola]
MTNFNKNDIFEVEIIDLTHEGAGVAKIDGYAFFVENALPGEVIEMRVMKTGKKFGFGKVESYLSTSEHRVTDINVDYLRTGIADFGHLAYPEQLKFKRKQIVDLLAKTAHKPDFPVLEPIASPSLSKYRNKASIPVRTVNGVLETGFFRKHSHVLVPVEDFFIQEDEIDTIVVAIRDLLRKYGLKAYNELENTGFIRNIVVRRAHATGEIMVTFVTRKLSFFKVDGLINDLTTQFPAVKSIMQNVNAGTGNGIFGSDWHILYGQDFITDTMLGHQFEISAPSFYQVNTAAAELLYQKAIELADLQPSDIVIDAYSGIGTIGLSLADKVAHVYGVEVVAAATDNAIKNAKRNQIDNVTYVTGKAEKVMSDWAHDGIKPDVILVDPPRKGLDEAFIQSASHVGARSIVYISCNAATFARDVVRFEAEGYKLDSVQPVDLFPQTHHVELVGLLTRNDLI